MKELIAAEIGPIYPHSVIHRVLNGSWSLYELIEYIIDFTGPANIFISSFSISEAAISAFQQMLFDGRIISLNFLLDNSLRKTRTDLLFYLDGIGAKVKLDRNHSKLILIHNNEYSISINASANMSRNRRTEALVIDTHLSTLAYYLQTMNQIFDTAIPI